MLGHLKAAAGIAGLLKVTLALHRQEILPSANFQIPNPKIPWTSTPFYVPRSVEPWPSVSGRPARAALSSFGFGGTNFHLTLERFEDEFHTALLYRKAETEVHGSSSLHQTSAGLAPEHDASRKPSPDQYSHEALQALEGGVLCFSGGSVEATIAQAQTAIGKWLNTEPLFDDEPAGLRLSQVAWEQLQQAGEGTVRLALAVTSWKQLRERQALLSQVADPQMSELLALQGIFLQQGVHPAADGKVAFLFPGQGSQYTGMLDDLRQRYRSISEMWERADPTLNPVLHEPLSQIVFPAPPLTTPESLTEAEHRLRATEHCQPAMLTSGVALLQLYRQHGLCPDMVGGHSLGEYTALVAADALPFPDALRAVAMRGTEMAALEPEDAGLMATVIASAPEIQAILDDCPGYVIAANKNSPRMTVIAGETPAVEAALARFKEGGIQTSLVSVSHAFHSRIVAPADKPLMRFLRTLEFRPPSLPVSSNLDGGFYPQANAGEAQDLILSRLGPQMSNPVEWTQQIHTMQEAGARIWVECGPKRSLSIFNQDLLGDKDHLIVTTNHPKQGGIATWLSALAKLWAVGQPIALPPLASDLHTPRPSKHLPKLPPGRFTR